MADIRAGIAKAKPHTVGGIERLRMLGALVRNRALVTLSIGAAFRSMTQSALLTFLPLYLARVMGYPTNWIGACMFALQAAASSPLRSPAISPTGSAAARSSCRACR